MARRPIRQDSQNFWWNIPFVLKRNETVLIEAFDIPDEMNHRADTRVRKASGVPFAQTYYTRVNRAARARSLQIDS